MNETLTQDEFETLDAVVAETIEPVAPPPELRRRIVEIVRITPQNSRTVRADEGRWTPLPFPGVKVKTLSVDQERGTATKSRSWSAEAAASARSTSARATSTAPAADRIMGMWSRTKGACCCWLLMLRITAPPDCCQLPVASCPPTGNGQPATGNCR